MKRLWSIGSVCLLASAAASMIQADDYVEDVYYWQDIRSAQLGGEIVPHYNKRVKEIVFIEDSTTLQHPDTVRAVIREVKSEK